MKEQLLQLSYVYIRPRKSRSSGRLHVGPKEWYWRCDVACTMLTPPPAGPLATQWLDDDHDVFRTSDWA
jgi:hypothetical protein